MTATDEPPAGAVPVLVGCAHGTRDPQGRATIARLLLAAGRLRPEVRVVPAFVDVQPPDLGRVLAKLGGQRRTAVIVPLLLSRGYHVHVDIAHAVERRDGAVVSDALGPSPRIADVLLDRLAEAGADPLDAVVLAAAGSSDARAAHDVEQVADHLRDRRPGPVVVAYLSACSPTVESAVVELVAGGLRVAVASYLLAPGFFAGRLDRLARGAGAHVVSAPLGDHPDLASLVLERYDARLHE